MTRGICNKCGTVIESESLIRTCLCRKCRTEYCRALSYKNYHINKIPFQLKMKRYYIKNREKILVKGKIKLLKLKVTVLSHYSISKFPQCSNLFGIHKKQFTDIRALSIDHIHGGGGKHKKIAGSGSRLYYWLKRNNYPKGYQVLCMNCQFIKRVEEHEDG